LTASADGRLRGSSALGLPRLLPALAAPAGKPSAPATATAIGNSTVLGPYGWNATWVPSATIGDAVENYKLMCFKVGEGLVTTCNPAAAVNAASGLVVATTETITRATTNATIGDVAADAAADDANLAPATDYVCYVVAFPTAGGTTWTPVCSLGTAISTPA
jgi:hypothetical protein